MITITERDILAANAVTANVSTFDVVSQLAGWVTRRETQPTHVEYLMSEQSITVPNQPTKSVISPAWLGRVKRRLEELVFLPSNWDSYGGALVDLRVARFAESLVEWFAVADMPPPDVFATSQGGIQIEWHVRRVNIEIDISPFDGTTIYFRDLNAGEPWSRPASSTDLQTARRRLIAPL